MAGPILLLIIAILLTGWLILAYLLIARRPDQFMRKRYRWLLFFSAILTASLWWIDKDPPYDNIWDTLIEIPLAGSLYCALFFFTFAGIAKLASFLSRSRRSTT
jgi:uncharacterized membrane protein